MKKVPTYKIRTLWTHKHINKVFKDKKKESKKRGDYYNDKE